MKSRGFCSTVRKFFPTTCVLFIISLKTLFKIFSGLLFLRIFVLAEVFQCVTSSNLSKSEHIYVSMFNCINPTGRRYKTFKVYENYTKCWFTIERCCNLSFLNDKWELRKGQCALFCIFNYN